MEVRPITSADCVEWVLHKHYAKRKPRMQYCYGLFVDGLMEGIVTFGYPATPFVSRGICGKDYELEVLELNRLVINEGSPKNSASFLVANAIKLLPIYHKIIVSFADTSAGHVGYVYQATNFLYTGLTMDMKEWRKVGANLHSQNVCKAVPLEERQHRQDYEQVWREKKHRYILFRGTKDDKRERLSHLNYTSQPYPKGMTARFGYTASAEKQSSLTLFD